MSAIADRYRRLSGEFADKVAQVSPERWNAPSPCEDWTARDVVAHIVDVHDRFVCFDLAIHGWDLARAIGLDETIAPADVVRLSAAVQAFGDALHQSGVCGPSVDVAPDADDQTKLLALLGRHV